ncbi:MAG: polysaccharide biosynthesis/export family protein [Candidatus Omnitrophica bacterium]|nr:polysaccharide biosynthesis/export family protein [Candidatus Omnitrophota bacterium]
MQEYVPVKKKNNIIYVEKIPTLQHAVLSYPYLLPEDYRLNSGDSIQIRFYGYFNGTLKRSIPENGEVVITSSPVVIPYITMSGGITPFSTLDTIPILGKFIAKGKKLKELEEEIREKLKEKYPETDVAVELIGLGIRLVHIVGDVPYPGYYSVSPLTRISGALAMGGIFENSEIKRGKIYIIRNGKKIEINLLKYINEGDLNSNPYVENGDIIIFKKEKK